MGNAVSGQRQGSRLTVGEEEVAIRHVGEVRGISLSAIQGTKMLWKKKGKREGCERVRRRRREEGRWLLSLRHSPPSCCGSGHVRLCNGLALTTLSRSWTGLTFLFHQPGPQCRPSTETSQISCVRLNYDSALECLTVSDDELSICRTPRKTSTKRPIRQSLAPSPTDRPTTTTGRGRSLLSPHLKKRRTRI